MRRAFLAFVLLAVLGATALLIKREAEVELPRPTGPFAVGRSIEDWAGTGHEVLAWIWYPAAAPGQPDDYVPAATRAHLGGGLLRALTHDLSRVRCHSVRNAAPRPGSYPVAIFRGGASAPVVNYSTLAEDLASHGYVVVGFDAPGRTGVVVFPDGRVVYRKPENNPELCTNESCYDRLLALWTADIGFVLDRLATRANVDVARAGVFGHSFGGAQAAQFCADDARCKAGIDIDGLLLGTVVKNGIHKPFMFLLSDHRGESGPEHDRVLADIKSVYDRLPPDGRGYVVLPGANHFGFSDDGALLKSRVLRALFRIDGRRQLAATAANVHTFFDATLKR
ncbi:MAG TPA: family membership [Thermoanaerobaculia bacterium]|nr:family membership [Thermoanaerobaculia bacterium]